MNSQLEKIKKDLLQEIDYQWKRTSVLYPNSDDSFLYRKGFVMSKLAVEEYINEKIEELKQRQDMLF